MEQISKQMRKFKKLCMSMNKKMTFDVRSIIILINTNSLIKLYLTRQLELELTI